MLYLGSTGCCGVQEILSLSSMASAEAAMLAFTKTIFKPSVSRYTYGFNAQKGYVTPYSHYTFTAAIYGKEEGKAESLLDPEFKLWNPYGHKFAQYIRDHKLGDVSTTKPVVNALNHPDHRVQIWIWTPDIEALHAWHTQMNAASLAEEARKKFEAAEEARHRAQKEALAAQESYEAAMKRLSPDFTLADRIKVNDPLKLKAVRRRRTTSASPF